MYGSHPYIYHFDTGTLVFEAMEYNVNKQLELYEQICLNI